MRAEALPGRAGAPQRGLWLSVVLAGAAALLPSSALAQSQSATYEVYAEVDGKNAPAWLAAMGRLTGSIKVASATETVTVKGDRWTIDSQAQGAAILSKVFDNLKVTRRSEGAWYPSGPATSRYTEKRGSREPESAAFDYRKGIVGFSRGSQHLKTEPVKYLTSDVLALPYSFLGRPRPTGPVTLAYTDGRNLRTAVFDGTVVFPYEVAGQKVPTVRFVARRPSPTSPEIEIWVRAEDGYPVRIKVGLSAKYGVRADAVATTLPAPRRAG
jgi:hypothetical protein